MIKKIIYAFLSLIALASCKKDEIMFYEGPDAISIHTSIYDADSTAYSFAYLLPEVTRDTLWLMVVAQGPAKSVDRKVDIQAISGTTAVEGRDYTLPEIILPAGKVQVEYPVVLLRSAELKTETKTLVVAVKENADFVQGALGRARYFIGIWADTYSIPQYTIKFDDFISKPDWWASLQTYIGAFSVVKLQFIFSVYGADADFESMQFGGERFNMRLRLQTALTEYEAINGPLMDENNQRVIF